MNFRYKAAAVVTALAFGATPAVVPALATAHGKAGTHSSTTPSFSSKAKRYGKNCQGTSKQHTKGVKGTPFSVCVTAAAKKANGSTKSPTALCRAEHKFAKHMKGEKRTPYSQCVYDIAHMHKK